jgi:hypothetical protein
LYRVDRLRHFDAGVFDLVADLTRPLVDVGPSSSILVCDLGRSSGRGVRSVSYAP